MPTSKTMALRAAEWRKNRIQSQLTLELTPRCNLNCKMCYVHLTPEQMGQRRELSTEQWLQVIREALDMGLMKVMLTGGECMLHPGFWEIYRFLREKGVITVVRTNGLLLTEENVARFRELPPNQIQVTAYGMDNDSYERSTGLRVFHQVEAGVQRVLDAGITVMMGVTGCRPIAADVPEILRFWLRKGVSMGYEFNMSEANPDTGRKLEDYSVPTELAIEMNRQIWHMLGKEIQPAEQQYSAPEPQDGAPDSYGIHCGAGRMGGCVHWDGRVSPCINFEGGFRVQEHSLAECWQEAIRVADSFPLPMECRDCPIKKACHSCVLRRSDPNRPGHCNPLTCRKTVQYLNAGLDTVCGMTIYPGAKLGPGPEPC